MPSLPILTHRPDPSRADLVRLFHRTESLWVGHGAEAAALDVGTAYSNPHLREVWDANNVRDAALPPGMSPAEAVAQVGAHYAERGTRCAYWVTNPSAAEGQTKPLTGHLLAIGHRARVDDILHLRKAQSSPAPAVEGVRVIPARASYRHARQLAEENVAERWGGNAQLVESHLLDLDNPQFEALLALRGDRAVATLGVLAAGDLGRIETVYVAADHRRQGLGRLLMSRALEVCARSLFKHVFILTAPDNAAGRALYAGFGFEKVGELTSYRAPQPA